MFYLQNLNQTGLRNSSRERLAGLDARSNWDTVNAHFRALRTNVSRKYEDAKLAATVNQDGLLNYTKRMGPLRQRFENDVRQAIARAQAAKVGLKEIYGYEEAIPGADGDDVLDTYLLWVRKAVNWVVTFTRMDQNYVRCISLRGLISAEEWNSGVASNHFSFPIKAELFPDQLYVRLRGIGCYVENRADSPNTLWHVTLVPPRKGKWLHFTGSDGELSQEQIPPCRLGRVSTSTASQPADVTGAAVLHNVSPLGQWNLSIEPVRAAASLGERIVGVAAIHDIFINLHLAVRWSEGRKHSFRK
jgi:hypothetical protein